MYNVLGWVGNGILSAKQPLRHLLRQHDGLWIEVDMELALINVDICRLTKHILHNGGAMKARAKSVYFESGCEKVAFETFKSLDS